jgi:hypothetical protein
VGIRLVVVDDNPHLAWEGRTYPANATFHRFLSAILDVEGAPVASIVHAVPLREADTRPHTLPLDPRIEVVGTAPFDGIEGYLRHLPAMLRANRPILRRAIAGADLLWLKVPASNAALAAAIAVGAGVPRFVWVAGSAADVASARYAGARGMTAAAVGLAYDGVGRAAGLGGLRIVVGEGLAGPDGSPGPGIVTSLVRAEELRDPAARAFPRHHERLVLAWAGRVAEGKGLEWLLREVAALSAEGGYARRVELVLVGDGPAHSRLAMLAAELGLDDRVRWLGYIADRDPYLDALAAADAFIHPSVAEGFPKVVLDAMTVGLPVLARPAGALRALAGGPVIALGDDLVTAFRELDAGGGAAGGWAGVAQRGAGFARCHDMSTEASRVIGRLEERFPTLPWA